MSDFPGFVAEPLDHIFNGCEKLFFFFFGIGIIISEVTYAIIDPSVAEVEVDGFGVTDVQNTVWLRRESGAHLPPGDL